MRPAGSQRNIAIPYDANPYYYSKIGSLPVTSKNPIAYGIYR